MDSTNTFEELFFKKKLYSWEGMEGSFELEKNWGRSKYDQNTFYDILKK